MDGDSAWLNNRGSERSKLGDNLFASEKDLLNLETRELRLRFT
jgi:hypothetical protein